MKKSLLAAAALLAATGAVAQSSVNMYGVVDTGYLFEKKSSATYGADGSLKKKEDTKTAGFNSGYLFGPRVGFKGEEALGNGLPPITLRWALTQLLAHSMVAAALVAVRLWA